MRRFLLFFIIISFSSLALAKDDSFESRFAAGLKSYQNQNYSEAEAAFLDALRNDHRNTAAMTNLALAYFQQKKQGHAIAWFRRALSIDPSFSPAREGLAFSLEQLEIKEIPHRIEMFESIRTHFLQHMSLPTFLGLGVLFLFASGWGLLSWSGARRRSLQSGEAVPSLPLSTIIPTLLFFMILIGTILKFVDISQPRGTVLPEKIEARSAPIPDAPALFELHQGFEVIIQNISGDQAWVQVAYPGGSTGWIPRTDLLPLETRSE